MKIISNCETRKGFNAMSTACCETNEMYELNYSMSPNIKRLVFGMDIEILEVDSDAIALISNEFTKFVKWIESTVSSDQSKVFSVRFEFEIFLRILAYSLKVSTDFSYPMNIHPCINSILCLNLPQYSSPFTELRMGGILSSVLELFHILENVVFDLYKAFPFEICDSEATWIAPDYVACTLRNPISDALNCDQLYWVEICLSSLTFLIIGLLEMVRYIVPLHYCYV